MSTTTAYAKTPARIDGMPVSGLGGEAGDLGEPAVRPELGQEHRGQDADRDADEAARCPTITSVPTIALPKPPPISNPAGGRLD